MHKKPSAIIGAAFQSAHIPVLLDPMLESLHLKPKGVYLDGTFGGGGYSRAILESYPDVIVHSLDRDPAAIERGQLLEKEYPQRFFIHHGAFSELTHIFSPQLFDGAVFDFGVSSFQLDEADRGFSFRFDGPLDMRMDPSLKGSIDAATVVNTFSEKNLTDILQFYGEEPYAKRVAKAIVEERKKEPFTTTLQLARCVRAAALKKSDIDNATLTFQGLRIFVNNELIEIDAALKAATQLLKDQGILVTVTFHSLEDRLCKQFFKKQTLWENIHRYSFIPLHRRPISPSVDELRSNPRARSAKLRAVEVSSSSLSSHKEGLYYDA